MTCAFLLELPSTARAQGEGRALLVWERARGAESCISGDELARAVESHAGRALLVTSGGSDVRAVGHVSRQPGPGRASPGGWRATIEISRRDGGAGSNRVVALEGKDCRGLDEALVLVLTVALEPLVPGGGGVAGAPEGRDGDASGPLAVRDVASGAVSGGVIMREDPFDGEQPYAGHPSNRGAEGPPVPGKAPAGRRTETAGAPARGTAVPTGEPEMPLVLLPAGDRADAARPRSRSHGVPHFRIAGSTAVSAGLMPAAAVGFGGFIAWIPSDRVSLEIAGRGFPFGQSPTDAGRVDFRLLYGEARACPAIVNATPLAVDACALFQAGEFHAEGIGFQVLDFSRSRPYLAWGAVLRVRVDVADPIFLRFGLEATRPIYRDQFVVEAEGRSVEVHRVAGVVGVAGADVGLSF